MADINLRAQPLNVFGTVGDDMQIVLTVVDSAGDPIDVSGYTISAKVFRKDTEVVEFTDAVSGASNNVITLSLTDAQTTTVTNETGLRWSLGMTTGGITEQWVGGKFELLNAGHPKASGVSAATLTYTSGNVTVTLGSISTTALDGRYAPPATTQSGTTYTVDAADNNSTVVLSNAAQVTVTLPTDASDDLVDGFRCLLFAAGAGGVTLSTSGLTLLGSSPNTTIAQNEGLYVEKTATANTWLVVGGTS